MKGTVIYKEGVSFDAKTESGYSISIKGLSENEGKNLSIRPMELMLLGLGGCMAIDVLLILRKMRQEIISYTVNISGERAKTPPSVFMSVNMEHILKGNNITATSIEKALNLAEQTYCSASAMFAKTAKISNTYLLVENKNEAFEK